MFFAIFDKMERAAIAARARWDSNPHMMQKERTSDCLLTHSIATAWRFTVSLAILTLATALPGFKPFAVAVLKTAAVQRGSVRHVQLCEVPMSKEIHDGDALAAVHETAEGLFSLGLISKTTMDRFDALCLTPVVALAPDEIRRIRVDAGASQAVFARYLNVSPGLVSQWERGEKKPGGAALKLLTLVSRKGLQAVA